MLKYVQWNRARVGRSRGKEKDFYSIAEESNVQKEKEHI